MTLDDLDCRDVSLMGYAVGGWFLIEVSPCGDAATLGVGSDDLDDERARVGGDAGQADRSRAAARPNPEVRRFRRRSRFPACRAARTENQRSADLVRASAAPRKAPRVEPPFHAAP